MSPEFDSLKAALADRYEFEDVLGEGGMGTVHLARDLKHGRRVAIKTVRPDLTTQWVRDRFEREINITAHLQHPHILPLLDSGVAGETLYYVMPYVEGESLESRLARDRTLPIDEVVRVGCDVAEGLEYAHEQGVIHRDIKPGNILLTASYALIVDFGIAKALAETSGGALTQTGFSPGSPNYMAPEQLDGNATARSDIYSLGVVLREAATGQGWRLGMEVEIDSAEVPPPLRAVIERALSSSPEERWPDAAAFRRALAASAQPERQRRPVAIWRNTWFRVAAVFTLITGGALAIPRAPSPPTPGAPVAVAPFINETGDSSLDALGNLAGDWIAQGLQQLGVLPVLPWPTVLEAARTAVEDDASADIVSYLAQELGAGIVITGSFYDLGDEIQFGAAITDAVTGELLTALSPISAPKDEMESAIRELRDRIMGSLALAADERLGAIPLSHEPPTFEAYRTFDRGIRLYQEQEYRSATQQFAEAFRQDTTFIVSLLYEATTLYNTGEYAQVDSVLGVIEPRRERLNEYQDNRWEYLRSILDGEGERALRVARRGVEMGPGSRASYNYARTAIQLNRPAEALRALEAVDPDRGAMKGWAQYWTQLSHATHLLGSYDRELAAATQMRERYPERRVASVLQARSLAARGDQAALEELLDGIAALAPRTYWSLAAALVVSGEELWAHGYEEEAAGYIERAIEWLEGQLAVEPVDQSNRYWLGTARYDLGRWPEAREVFEGLVRDFPERGDYRGLAALAIGQMAEPDSALTILGEPPKYDPGDHLSYRARLEYMIGDPDRAIDFFSEALGRGISGLPWLHASALHDLWELSDQPRFRRLLDRASEMP